MCLACFVATADFLSYDSEVRKVKDKAAFDTADGDLQEHRIVRVRETAGA